jgi:hypothetical protein
MSKPTTLLPIAPILLLTLISVMPANAQVQSNQTTTTCINGKCTTVSGTVTPSNATVRRIPTSTPRVSAVNSSSRSPRR